MDAACALLRVVTPRLADNFRAAQGPGVFYALCSGDEAAKRFAQVVSDATLLDAEANLGVLYHDTAACQDMHMGENTLGALAVAPRAIVVVDVIRDPSSLKVTAQRYVHHSDRMAPRVETIECVPVVVPAVAQLPKQLADEITSTIVASHRHFIDMDDEVVGEKFGYYVEIDDASGALPHIERFDEQCYSEVRETVVTEEPDHLDALWAKLDRSHILVWILSTGSGAGERSIVDIRGAAMQDD